MNHNAVANLLLLYAGTILINSALSGFLWLRARSNLYLSLFFVWLATLTNFVVQAFTTQNSLFITLGFSCGFLISLAAIKLIESLLSYPVQIRNYLIIQAGGYVFAIIFYVTQMPFWLISLPVACSVAAPLLVIPIKILRDKPELLSFSTKGLLYSYLVLALHVLDFPILRMRPEFSSLGFTIACLIIFALSIFGFSAGLEATTRDKSRISAEVEVAQRIQMEILPKKPKIPLVEIACHMKPAEDVGGDYYDIFSFRDYSWIILGDVTGHGLGSGLVMFMAQSIISSILQTKNDISPSSLNHLANKILFQNLERLNEKRPMTIATICMKKDANVSVSGCHDNIYIYRAKSEQVETITLDHFPFGIGFTDMLERSDFTESTFRLDQDDVLFIGTDGITEAVKANGSPSKSLEMFGEERLTSFLQAFGKKPVEEVRQRLLEILDEFTGGLYSDDVTFIIARLKTQF